MSNKKTAAASKPKSPAKQEKSHIVAIISDIHFDLHDEPTWRAFCAWHTETRPTKTVILGDFLDLGMMSRYVQGMCDPLFAIPQIKMFVEEANKLATECGELVVVEGNHDERWGKLILGNVPHVFKGALGLTLREQCMAQGLDPRTKWLREDTVNKGLVCGPFVLRHGHNQGGRFGGGKHLAANRLAASMGQNEVFGHHHQIQMHCHTARGRTSIALANGCMTGDHEYNKDPSWQRGFTVLELFGPDNQECTPHPIIIQKGRFSWGGKVYDGSK